MTSVLNYQDTYDLKSKRNTSKLSKHSKNICSATTQYVFHNLLIPFVSEPNMYLGHDNSMTILYLCTSDSWMTVYK